MIADKDNVLGISEEEESGSSSSTMSQRIAAICEKHGIPFRDTTLEHEGQVSVRFVPVESPKGEQ